MILDSKLSEKRFFDPKSKRDMEVATSFFKTHSWGHTGCPFYLEFPYMTIPDMMKDKIIHKTLGIRFDGFHHVWSSGNAE